MAKAAKRTQRPVAPVRMTKRQISRHEREERQKRLAIAGVAIVLALIVLIPTFGLWREVLAKSDQPLATVAGEDISIGTYAKVLGFRQYVIQQQIADVRNQAVALATPTPAGSAAAPSPTPTTGPSGQPSAPPTPSDPQMAALERRFQELQSDYQLAEITAQDDLINDVLVRQELARRGITVSPQEVDQAIASDRSLGNTSAVLPGQPTPSDGAAGAQPAAPSLVQLPGLSTDEVKQLVTGSGYLSWEEFRRWVAEPRARSLKLQSILGETVPARAEQVHARQILVKTQEEADKVLARLQAGEDFAALAKELSTDDQTKDKGGDLGWFPRGVMDPAFDEAVFQMSAGALPTQAVRTSFGYHLIKVDEFQPQRDLEPAYLSQLRQTAYERWLTELKSTDGGQVNLQYTADKRKWVNDFIAKSPRG